MPIAQRAIPEPDPMQPWRIGTRSASGIPTDDHRSGSFPPSCHRAGTIAHTWGLASGIGPLIEHLQAA